MIERMEITHVYQENRSEQVMDIYFSVQNHQYSVNAHHLNGLFKPVSVYHESDQLCLFCGEKARHSQCHTLIEYQEKLFKRLIEMPSIRLEWIYLKHV